MRVWIAANAAKLDRTTVRLATGIDFRHADVDLETFHPQTIALLLAVIRLLQSASLPELASRLADPSSPLRDDSAQALAIEDILVRKKSPACFRN